MSDPIPLPADVRPRFRKWVYGCLAAIIAAIGIEPTMKAVEAGLKYYRENPLPAKEAPATNAPPIVVTNAPAPLPEGWDAIDISSVRNLGTHANIKVQKLPVTRTLRRAYIKGDSLCYEYSPTGWKDKGGGLAVRNYIFWMSGGQLVGGHFEWSQDGRVSRGLKNIRNGYLSDMKPASGDRIWACIADCPSDRTATQRSNVVDAGRWP